jgi:hypothetical protein
MIENTTTSVSLILNFFRVYKKLSVVVSQKYFEMLRVRQFF